MAVIGILGEGRQTHALRDTGTACLRTDNNLCTSVWSLRRLETRWFWGEHGLFGNILETRCPHTPSPGPDGENYIPRDLPLRKMRDARCAIRNDGAIASGQL
jgi:hypothetical protein